MKKYVIATICLLMLSNAWGKLRNGYEKDIHHVGESLKNYIEILNTNKNLSQSDRRKMRNRINDLIAYQSYYDLTEELLKRFKSIAPNLYDRVDSINDAKGRPTDVYVKFIPRDEALIMAGGITTMARSDEDKDACFSEYGKHTVSIKIWIFSKALFALSHELGHVNYQVPNLKTYIDYYKVVYRPYVTESNHIGHADNDRSGKNASTFEREFKKCYFNYTRLRNGDTPSKSPQVLVEELKRRIL